MTKKSQWRVTECGDVVVMMDRRRTLRLTHKAMKTFTALTNVKLEGMEDAIQDPTKLEALYYAAFKADAAESNEALKVGDMEALMDTMTPGALLGAAGKAIELAYADAEPEQAEAQEQTNPTDAVSTG